MRISDWSSDVCSSDLFAAPAARKPLRFLGGDKAFVEAHLAVLTDLDVHTAALALARMGMIPRPEPPAGLHHDDIGTTGVQIVGLAGIDRCHLRRPECIAVGKEPIFAERVDRQTTRLKSNNQSTSRIR